MMRHAQSYNAARGLPAYSFSVSVVATEALKATVAIVAGAWAGEAVGRRGKAAASPLVRCVAVARGAFQTGDVWKMAIPAAVYAVQNNLVVGSSRHLAAGTLLAAQQLKILTAGLFTVILLRRRLSVGHWACLAGLAFSVFLASGALDPSVAEAGSAAPLAVRLVERLVRGAPAGASPVVGWAMVSAAALLSGFAGAWTEMQMKGGKGQGGGTRVGLWTRNTQMALGGAAVGAVLAAAHEGVRTLLPEGAWPMAAALPAALAGPLLNALGPAPGSGLVGGPPPGGPFRGFSWPAWCVVGLQALGGLLIGAILRLSPDGTVIKTLSTSSALLLTVIVGFFAFDEPLTPFRVAGLGGIVLAVFTYSRLPPPTPLDGGGGAPKTGKGRPARGRA